MHPEALPCKGYGECILPQTIKDGKHDCYDGSDEGLGFEFYVTANSRSGIYKNLAKSKACQGDLIGYNYNENISWVVDFFFDDYVAYIAPF